MLYFGQMAEYREQAIEAIQNGDRNTALQLLQKSLGVNPRDVESWLLLAQVVNAPEKKRECFKRVLRISPNHPAALEGLAALDAGAAADIPTTLAVIPTPSPAEPESPLEETPAPAEPLPQAAAPEVVPEMAPEVTPEESALAAPESGAAAAPLAGGPGDAVEGDPEEQPSAPPLPSSEQVIDVESATLPERLPAKPSGPSLGVLIAVGGVTALALTVLLLAGIFWFLSSRGVAYVPSPAPTRTAPAPTAVPETPTPSPYPTPATTLPAAQHKGLPGGITPGGWTVSGITFPAGGGPFPVDTLYLFPDGTFLFLGWGPYDLVDERTLHGCGLYQGQGTWKFCFQLRVDSVTDKAAKIYLTVDFPMHPESNVRAPGMMNLVVPDSGPMDPTQGLAGHWKIAGSQALTGTELDLLANGSAAITDDSGTRNLGPYTASNGTIQFGRINTLWWRIHSLGSVLFLQGGNEDSGMMFLERVK
jgi:hypothetical protein